MKRIKKYSVLILLLVGSLHVFATGEKGKYRKSKKISKTYNVAPDNTLAIRNEYGDINIVTWDKDVLQIEVYIIVESNEEEVVTDKLNDIQIVFLQEANRVLAKTMIRAKRNDNWNFSLFSLFSKSKSLNFSIDYEVKLPRTNAVDLQNEYGNINIESLDGNCKIDNEYGSIRLGTMRGNENHINLEYAPSSTIDYITHAKINADYSKLSIDEAESIHLDAEYSNLDFDTVSTLVFDTDYGSFRIGSVGDIRGDSDYLSMKIDEIRSNLKVDFEYGSIKIYKVLQGFDKIDIDTEYSSVKIGVSEAADFTFDLENEYAGISLGDLPHTLTSRIDKMDQKKWKGYVGNPSAKSHVVINSEYGGIKLYKAD